MSHMKNIEFKIIETICILIVSTGCILYIIGLKTVASYESSLTTTVSPSIATWNITVNDQNITTPELKEIKLNDIMWENNYANPTKVAPSSKGKIVLNINPTTTSVAIKYDLKIVDNTVDENKILTVTSLTSGSNDIIKTAEDTYTGLITLDEISAGTKKEITINLEWINDDANDDYSKIDQTDNVIDITFTASQYKGEALVEYK